MTAKLKREIDWSKAEDRTYGETDYYTKVDTSSYASSCNVSNFKYYNCKTNESSNNWSYGYSDCTKYSNSILIHYEASCNKSNAVIKLDTKWTYKEYEY